MKKYLALALVALSLTGLAFAQGENTKVLILYYSYTGNTRGIALQVYEKLGSSKADIVEIEPVVPYSKDYDTVVDQGHREVNRGYEPEIKPLGVNVADYDVVVIGTPVWWYHVASPVKTVISQNDWKGKSVYTFATNAGWIGQTFSDYEKWLKGADIKSKMNILFSSGSDRENMKTPQKEIDDWIESIKNN